MEYTHVIGAHWHWCWIVPFLFMILMFVFATRMCRRTDAWRHGVGYIDRGRFGCCVRGRGTMTSRWSETPLQILDRRYASGEITHDEYEQMKPDVELSPSHSGSEDEK